jgi:hypothetical protein
MDETERVIGPEAEEEAEAPTVLTSRKASLEERYRPGESAIVEWVEGLMSDAEQGRRDQCDPDVWGQDRDTYWGDQWSGKIPSYKPRIVVNEIKSLVLQELSDLTDSRIKVYVQKNRENGEQDDLVQKSIETYWTRKFCDMTVLKAALDAMINPLGFIQTGWNPRAEQGQGEITFSSRDPISVYPDPDAEDDDSLAYFLLEDVLDLIQIRRDFPETGWLVPPEGAYSEKLTESHDRPAPRAGSGYTGPLYSRASMSGVPGYKKARARMMTCVVDDDELMEEVHTIDGRLQARVLPKYPNRRMIIVANRRVLYNDDCPYHHAPILSRVALQPTVHSYWPQNSIVNEYGEIQSTANKLDSLVAENALRLNMGEVIADADSGINPKTYGGIPGAVYLVKPGSRVQKIYPTAMPPDMIQSGERFRGFIRTNMGYPLSRTGAGTHGNVAAELAETEISQSMGLTRLRGRLLYQSVQKAVEMIFARMAQFYTTPRHLPYIEGGSLKSIRWEPIAKPESYAVHVDEATFQVQSQTMLQRVSLALAKMGKMPNARLLKTLKIPDAEKVAEELTAELKLMAMARMQQGKKGRR